MKKSTKSNIITAVIGGGALLLITAIILILELAPMVKAKKAFSERLEATAAAEKIVITDLLHNSFNAEADGEVTVSDAAESARLLALFRTAAESAEYSETDAADNGSWGIRMRFYSGGSAVEFYFDGSVIFIESGSAQYRFKPTDGGADAYDELYRALTGALSANAD